MRAVQVTKLIKDLSELRVADVAKPIIGPKEVLVKVEASALNFFDGLQARGIYQNQPKLPFILGAEFAGFVTEVGSEVKQWKRGDRVFGSSQGAFAEYVAVRQTDILRCPSGWSMVDSCGLFVTAPTSFAALVSRANVQPNEVVLIHAAAGGVSLAAVQIAKALGAKVIAMASSDKKLAVAKHYGADYLINYKQDDWVKKVNEMGGADVIYDSVGEIEKDLRVVKWSGRILLVGFANGKIPSPKLNRVLLKNCSIVGIHWGGYLKNEIQAVPRIWQSIFALIEKKQFKPTVFETIYSLDQITEALSTLESRQSFGKIVLQIGVNSAKL